MYVLLGVGVFASAIALAWLGRRLYVTQVRRSLLAIVKRREAVRAADRALREVLASLAEAGDAQLVLFATGSSSEERRAVKELEARMRIVADELGAMGLPKRLWRSATLLQDAAEAVLAEAGKVDAQDEAGGVVEALSRIDLTRIDQASGEADEELDGLLDEYGLHDPAVYGGGLYI